MRKTKFRPPRRLKKLTCPFCEGKKDPSYKESEYLKNFMSERGRIVGRDRNGACLKHQKMLAREIKRSRHLALINFISRV